MEWPMIDTRYEKWWTVKEIEEKVKTFPLELQTVPGEWSMSEYLDYVVSEVDEGFDDLPEFWYNLGDWQCPYIVVDRRYTEAGVEFRLEDSRTIGM